jgi:hypothetical protein
MSYLTGALYHIPIYYGICSSDSVAVGWQTRSVVYRFNTPASGVLNLPGQQHSRQDQADQGEF